MPFRYRVIVAATALHCVGCASDPSPVDKAHYKGVDIPLMMSEARVPGLAITTLTNCEVDETLYFGVEDIESGDQISRDTVFEAASLTKPLFAYIVMQLVDEGVIDLDAPLADEIQYARVPDKESYAKLTPRVILSHRTGFPNWAGDPVDPETWRDIEFLEPPNTKYRYSGEAYQLLQAYVEFKTGKSLDRLFAERLGTELSQTSLSAPREGVRLSFGHDENGLKEKGVSLRHTEKAGAAFSANSNAADYATFVSALCKSEGLSANSLIAMLTPHSQTVQDEVSWALGVGVQTLEGNQLYFHWGDNGPFKSFWILDRERRKGVVFFANGTNGLKLIEPLSEPVVGDVWPVVDWLDYGRMASE